MKHISRLFFLLLAIGLLPALAQAQAPGTDSLRQKLTSIFAHIDKSQVPTGYLYEAGVRFLEPRHYNGVLSDSNRTDMNVLRYLRAQLQSCRVYGSDTLPSLPAFNIRIKGASAAANGAIPIAMQYVPYASIKPTALQANLLTVQNEQVYDVAGRTQSPYQTNVLFAAAPALAYAPTNTVSFLFRRNLYLTGNGVLPSGLYLDFDDGRGYRPATWGQPLATTYATAGTKRVKVKVVFTAAPLQAAATAKSGAQTQAQAPNPGGTVAYESHFDFEVQTVVAGSRYDNSNGFSWYCSMPNGRPGANVSVRYGRGHGQHVVKPFIVVEQYNLAGAAPHLIDCNNPNNTVERFLPQIDIDFLRPSTDNFNNALEAAGYDLIYIDFERNTDDITRNAEVFEKVMSQVNQWKYGSSALFGLTVYQNVVMGMSMGGLIARYGLAAMTKNTTPYGAPDTRLLVLHDSPQRGAYNPVGLQSFTRSCDVPLNTWAIDPVLGSIFPRKLRDFDDRIDDAVNVLDEPATQQLAILTAFNGRGDIRPNTFIDGVYKAMVDFTLPANASGPQPGYQIEATSDGSQCGRGSGAPLGVLLSSANTYTNNWLAPQALSGVSQFYLGVRGAAYGLPAYGQRSTVSAMRVYIEFQLRIGSCPFCVRIPIRFDLLNESALSPPNTLPYETLPGGTTNLAVESGNCGTTGGLTGFFLKTGLYNGPICFVPTYSALDVATVTPATAAVSYLYGAPPTTSAVPRVARFIAQEQQGSAYNLNHLTFAARNSEWIFNEMEGLSNSTLNCQTECTPYPTVPITGLDIVCAGSTGTTFSVAPPFGSVTSWTASPAGLVTLPATTAGATSITVTPASSTSSGFVTLTAHISNGCFPTTATRRVVVGQGYLVVSNTQVNPYGTCAVPTATFTITESYGSVGPYTWRVYNSGVSYTISPDTRTITLTGLPYQNYGLYGSVEGPSTCPGGLVNGSFSQQYTTNYGGYPCQSFRMASSITPPATLYPNPARETVDVHVDNADAAHPVTVRLFDSYGQARAEQVSQGETTLRLKTDHLPAGLYFVHILRGKEVLSRQQLRIEK